MCGHCRSRGRIQSPCIMLFYFSIFCLHLKFSLIKSENGEFHDGLGVSTPGFHCHRLGSIPVRELRSCNLAAQPQKKTPHLGSGSSFHLANPNSAPGFQVPSIHGQGNHHSSLNSAFLSKHWVSQHPRFPPSFVCGWIMESCLLPPGSFLFSST